MNKLLTGFALGMLVGILYAPDKGTYTRRKIVDKGNDLKDQFADFIDNIAGKFENAADEVEEYANIKAEDIRSEAI